MSRRRRRRRGNSLGVLAISAVVVVLMISLAFQSSGLKKKLSVYAREKETLEQQIAAEEARAKEIDELEEYKKTIEYVEEVAKDKLGMIYENEILFVPEK